MGRPGRRDPALVRILVTGAAGFINGYLVPELLEAGHEVIGLDDFSKYGRLTKSYDDHPRYRFVEGDAKDVALVARARRRLRPGRGGRRDDRRDQLLPRVRLRPAGRERADPGVDVRRARSRRIATAISSGSSSSVSSMVYESATVFPTPEGAQLTSPPPVSTYGFQKLASEYFAKGAWEQFQLPYTIVRPFNCVGHRRAPGRARHRHHVRQREAAPSATSCPTSSSRCSRARTRSTSWATATRSATTRTAATWPTASAWRWSRRRPSTTTSTSRPRRRRRSSSWPRRSGARSTPTAGRSASSATRRSSTTSSCASPTCARRARSSASRRRRRSTRCSTRSSPGSATELEAGRL